MQCYAVTLALTHSQTQLYAASALDPLLSALRSLMQLYAVIKTPLVIFKEWLPVPFDAQNAVQYATICSGLSSVAMVVISSSLSLPTFRPMFHALSLIDLQIIPVYFLYLVLYKGLRCSIYFCLFTIYLA